MNFLQQILEQTRTEIERSKKVLPLEALRSMPGFSRKSFSLNRALKSKSMSVIAEIKKASPSKGIIRQDFNPMSIADEYVSAGAQALSVLTEKQQFQGNIRFISDMRAFVPIPILRKEFMVDSYQITEAKAFGADAILLIVAALEPNRLRELHQEAREIGLECLVEVHNEHELESLDFNQVKMIGINNRDLTDFTVDLSTSIRLAARVPKTITLVSESGISNRSDLDLLANAGFHAVLVGESLMRAKSPGNALRVLRGEQAHEG
jgi:indole-3-glycerol phosphate synthase